MNDTQRARFERQILAERGRLQEVLNHLASQPRETQRHALRCKAPQRKRGPRAACSPMRLQMRYPLTFVTGAVRH